MHFEMRRPTVRAAVRAFLPVIFFHRRINSQTKLCDNLLAWAVGSAPSGKARVLTRSLHALGTPFNIRVRFRGQGCGTHLHLAGEPPDYCRASPKYMADSQLARELALID